MSRPRSLLLWRGFSIGLLPYTGCHFLWLKCRGIARGASGAAVPGGSVGSLSSRKIKRKEIQSIVGFFKVHSLCFGRP